jgi:hypothetical protein
MENYIGKFMEFFPKPFSFSVCIFGEFHIGILMG